MSRPPQRFVIRRISIGANTNLPWTLTDNHRPSHVGRYPTMTAALAAVDRERRHITIHYDDRARELQHRSRPLLPPSSYLDPPRRAYA